MLKTASTKVSAVVVPTRNNTFMYTTPFAFGFPKLPPEMFHSGRTDDKNASSFNALADH
jgi:hypothetical protein